jgi:alpha-tubulin suppressor-like RCC1 family protein
MDRRRTFRVLYALVLAAPSCRDDAGSPVEPTKPESQVSVAATLVFRQVSAGGIHSCGVTTDNLAYCWGYNVLGQLGVGTKYGPQLCLEDEACSTRPVLVARSLVFRTVSAGWYHTCGVTTEDLAYCWGNNFLGKLGDGSTTDRLTPVAVRGGLRFRHLSAGAEHTCGVTTEGIAYCWGANYAGQLGEGSTTNRLTPVAVAGGRQFRHVSAAGDHTCGVTTANVAFCWGDNTYGQLGDSTLATRRLRPARVAGGRYYRQLEAGDFHTCAVTTGDRAFCWGNGTNGQIGNTRKAEINRWPRAVAGGLSVDRVTAGRFHSCGETTGNRAYCWGANFDGQLGNGTDTGPETTCPFTACSTRPVAVSGGLYFDQVDAGGTHTCAKTPAGVAYCWGNTEYGDLGDGRGGRTSQVTPTAVLNPL